MFQISSLQDLELLRESSDLECKLAAGRDGQGELPAEFWKSYSAMANSDGGTILLGIKERKETFELHGIPQPDRVLKQLFDQAENRNKVSLNLLADDMVQMIELEGRMLLQIQVPRASRQQRPVYLNGNPLGNTYVRRHEGDYRLPDDSVKRMLAEQHEDSRDAQILANFGLDDLHHESLRIYRQIFTNLDSTHPWNELAMEPFLLRIGAMRKDRERGVQGLTAAGLLMFGSHPVIQEVYPYYMLDYQERPEARTEARWIDRVTLDGSWSGNLYDFYRIVYPKLTRDLRVPFVLEEGQRLEESHVHVALREALCNVLVHADYSDRASVLVVKRPDMFGFRNPGMMRIPIEDAMRGGNPDCRNRLLHQMFRYVGIGDQAGSGIPKIMHSWHQYHWRPPELVETSVPNDQTVMRMRMIDLLPQSLVDELRGRYGPDYDNLPHEDRVALAIAATEGIVSHQRLCSLVDLHPADASLCLHELVQEGFLEKTGSSRGAVYHLTGVQIPGPEDVFDLPEKPEAAGTEFKSSPHLAASSPHKDTSSPHLDVSSPHKDTSSPHMERDRQGRLLDPRYDLPFVDRLDVLDSGFMEHLCRIAHEARSKGRLPKETMQAVLLELLAGHFIALSCLAELVDRDPKALRDRYLRRLIQTNDVRIAFPRTPNDPRQAYTKADA